MFQTTRFKPYSMSILIAVATGAFSLTNTAEAGDPNVHVDVKRSLSKQKDAADAAAKVVQQGPKSFSAIVNLLADPAAPVRDKVIAELRKWPTENIAKLAKGLRAKNSLVIEGIAEVAGEKKVKELVPDLIKALSFKKSEDAPSAVFHALAEIGDDSAWKPVLKYYKGQKRNFRLRGDALYALSKMNANEALPLVKAALKDKLLATRVMALVILSDLDRKTAASAATTFMKGSVKERDKVWAPKLLFVALDVLTAMEKRSDLKAELSAAIDQMIVLLEKAKGREQHELGVTLRGLTGAKNLAPDHLAWKSWWSARKADWEPKDKPKKTKKGEDADAGMTGSVVRFHGIPIHSLRVAFVQDVSGGMKNPVGGRKSDTPAKLTVSKEELNKVLKLINDAAYVNLLYFATYFYKGAPKPVPIKKLRRKLMDYNNKQQIPGKSGHGRSNIFDVTRFAIAQPNIDTVYILTEGGPTEGKYVDRKRFMKHLSRINVYYRARVHTLLMGSSSDGPPFLRALAKTTGAEFYDLKKLKK
ncbi:MAG: hypothetical protein P1V97_02615 [Planctomycetota bacterium]|nr:hypothetical protein [Planctomycetota bacterium]